MCGAWLTNGAAAGGRYRTIPQRVSSAEMLSLLPTKQGRRFSNGWAMPQKPSQLHLAIRPIVNKPTNHLRANICVRRRRKPYYLFRQPGSKTKVYKPTLGRDEECLLNHHYQQDSEPKNSPLSSSPEKENKKQKQQHTRPHRQQPS